MDVETHKNLDVWKLSMDLVEKINLDTKTFPNKEMYGILSQMRRSAVSVQSIISDGSARNSRAEYVRVLYISLASLSELETQVTIPVRLKYLNNDTLLSEIE